MFCLGFCTAAATEAKDLDQRLRQIKAARQLPGQPFEIDELSFDVLHRFAARADQVVMRFEIAVHAQRGRMRSDLSQQPTLDEKPQIVVDRGERNGWNATSDRGVNAFWGMVSVGSDDGLIDHLTLVRDRQTVLRGQLTKLFMGEAHDYRMRMIIKRPRAVSTEIFPVTSKSCAPLHIARGRHELESLPHSRTGRVDASIIIIRRNHTYVTSNWNCLALGRALGYYVADQNGRTWELTSNKVDLAKHMNHVVSVSGHPSTGSKPQEGKSEQGRKPEGNQYFGLDVTELDMLSPSCTR